MKQAVQDGLDSGANDKTVAGIWAEARHKAKRIG